MRTPVARGITRRAHNGAGAALAFRRVARVIERLRAVLSVGMRDRDTSHAHIHQLEDQRAFDVGNAHKRRDARSIGGTNDMGAGIKIQRAVLHVDDDKIDACRGGQFGDHRTAAEQDQAGDGVAPLQCGADGVFHGRVSLQKRKNRVARLTRARWGGKAYRMR